MKHADFKKLTGWIDYDRAQLPKLTYHQKVLYFDKRLSMVLIKPLIDVFNGISKAPKQSSLLIFATSVCCAIEALGKFKEGLSKKNNQRFKGFLSYMNPDFKRRILFDKKYEKILWKYFRNGLAHGFAICHGGFEHQTNYFNVKQMNGIDVLMIDPKRFYLDFRSGLAEYLRNLRNAPPGDPLRDNFENVFQDVFINGK